MREMSGFSPVLVGEAPELRQEIESVFASDSDAITERLSDLGEQARLLGSQVTFGAEIEAAFVLNPNDPRSADLDDSDIDIDRVYEEVVRELIGYDPGTRRGWYKGAVIHPDVNPEPVMVNPYEYGTYNPDQRDIMEVRTAPADAVEATKRYWNTIQAIGTIAERHGYMGIILATHLNAAVYQTGTFDGQFIDFTKHPEGGKILAAAQRNLNALYPLQTHAGLQEGISVLEAYPENKNASTAVQNERLEMRHPSIGVVDPRVDMLAVLEAVNRAKLGKLTTTEMEALHRCSPVEVMSDANCSLGGLAPLLRYQNAGVLWDENSRKLVMPALVQTSAGDSDILDFVTRLLTKDVETSASATDAAAVKLALGSLSIRQDRLRLRGRNAATILRPIVNNVEKIGETEVFLGTPKHRIVPTVIYDSPENHALQRTNIVRSSAVRRIMGASVATLTPAREALDRRRELIENQMIAEPELVESTGTPLDIVW